MVMRPLDMKAMPSFSRAAASCPTWDAFIGVSGDLNLSAVPPRGDDRHSRHDHQVKHHTFFAKEIHHWNTDEGSEKRTQH